jgi:chromosomal replication initiation ATPase DnaA
MMPSAHQVARALSQRDLLELVGNVCRTHGVTVDEVCGRTRTQAVSWARHETWWRLRHHPERHYSLAEIGRLFGRDHTTVLHGIQAHRLRGAHALIKPAN